MIIKLQGGLGNQMFQYAYGRSKDPLCKFDRSWLLGDRTYALGPFKLPIQFIGHVHDPKCPVKDGNFCECDAIFEEYIPEGAIVESGYWQGEKYFDADLIRPLLSHPGKIIKNAVAVHIRLTDNLSERALALHGNLLETDYYERAFKFIKKKVSKPDLLIFSDDPDECSKYFDDRNIVRGNQPHEDLWLMSKCEYHIIANSSFSWWGAWLGPQKLVIAPNRWFVHPELADPTAKMEDIVPDRWIRL